MNEIFSWINGAEFKDREKKIEVYSPIQQSVIAHAYLVSAESLNEIMPEIKKSQNEWKKLTIKKRVQVMFKLRGLFEQNKERLAECIHIENRKTMNEAFAEVEKSIELLEFSCSLPVVLSKKIQEVSTGIEVKEVTEPVGIVCSITPFNFPLMVPMWTIPNIISTGNAMILKPSEQTPMTSLLLARLLKEAGLPDGIFNVLLGDGLLGKALCEHPDIETITFVGSTPVAKSVYRVSTQSLKRCLAMGGAKNHLIVTPDTDPEITAKEVLSAAFGMAGQRCMAASVVVIVGKNKNFKNELIKQAKDYVLGTDLPTMISEESMNKIEKYLEDTKGNILVDGRLWLKNKATDIGPSIIEYKSKTDMPDEEIFGPTLELLEVKTLNDAFNIQKSSPYANGASIFTQNGRTAAEAINVLTSGMIGVNVGVPVPRDPFGFGGLKLSKFGAGDITGIASLPLFTNTKKITTKWNPENKIDWMS